MPTKSCGRLDYLSIKPLLKEKGEIKASEVVVMPEEQLPAATDYIAEDLELPATPVARWNANIRAIRLLKDLEAQGRQATPQEQRILAQYAGFGDSAFESAFGHYRPTREGAERDRWEELRDATTDEELRAIYHSRLNAFYTNPVIVRGMWQGLKDLGADDLNTLEVLEPSAGSGRFLAYQPQDLARKSRRTAVELDRLTARMLAHLNPETKVWHSGFEEAPLPDNHYDIAISNVPFGSYSVHDPEYIREGKKYLTQQGIHNYFFAKTLDKLKPGGVLAFITSHHTLNAPARRDVREYLADQADLVGAVRLPQDVFPDTSVVTDIIFLRKRKEGEEPGDDSWVETQEMDLPNKYGGLEQLSVNQYFLDNPGRVLGKHSAEGSMRAFGSYTVKSDSERGDIESAIGAQMQNVAGPRPRGEGNVLDPEAVADTGPGPRAKFRGDGMYQKDDKGVLRVQKLGKLVKPALSATDTERVSQMVEMRDIASRLMDMESGNEDDGEIEELRRRLKDHYDRFVEKNGHLNNAKNRALMQGDPGAMTLAGLETPTRDGKTWNPATLFTRRVIGRQPERSVGNPNDAMLVTLNETGRLDFDQMGQLLGESPSAVRDSLERDRLIFRNPVSGSYETASTYLTGDVRQKHRQAQQYAAQEASYQTNVDALAEVLPAKVQAHEIATPLGAPWIPDEVVNRWAHDHLSQGIPGNFNPNSPQHRFYAYNPANGQWFQPRDIPLSSARAYGEFGTTKRGGDEILLAALQGKSIQVKAKDADGNEYVDSEATIAVQEKAKEIQKSFEEWVWEDETRKQQLVDRYNDIHNSVRPRLFDGSHQTFPGMAAKWQEQMREHQMDAIYRTVHDGTALLAHEVGFGKTAVMVAAAMERKRLGLASKAVFVVPKATHEQFGHQFLDIYPNAKILTPDKNDFKKENRQAFLNRMATGDWDGIVLTGEQFNSIPVSPELEARWIQEQKWEYEEALRQMQADHEGSKRKGRQKELETKISDFEARLRTLREEMKARTDEGMVRHFDKMGVDQLFVDEADRYKNLKLHTQMGDVKGMPGSGSNRALDMLMKVRHVQEKGGESAAGFTRHGVVFATGTPIANTIAEAWTMMRYLQLPELRKRGLEHFDAWAKTYGEITEGLEATPQGTYKNTQRFARFVNLPELSQLFQNVADIRVASEVPAMLEVQPCLTDDAGDSKRITVVAPNHEPLREYMGHIRERVDQLGTVSPTEDNMLKISTDARKAALDLRMIDPYAPPNSRGKIQLAAENIADNFKNETENFGTQLVFLDYGTPKAKDKKKESTDDDGSVVEEGESAGELQELSNLYGTLKQELVARGVPADQIAFIHDAKDDKSRQKLFNAVNKGDIRILVGSTEKIGVGVNVQERAYAAHHLDVPWRPRDVEQREGRIIRQGNEVYGPVVDPDTREVVSPGKCVRIYQYVQEGSFDEFMWQAVEVKANAIKSLLRRNITSRSAEDIDNIVLSAGEARALASGDPLVLEREKLRNQVRNLRMVRDSHRSQMSDARMQLERLARRIDGYRNRIPKLEVDAAHVTGLPDDAPFGMAVENTRFDKRPEAGKALQTAMNGLSMTYEMGDGAYRKIGEYRGFEVRGIKSNRGWQLQLVNPATEVPHNSAWIEDVTPMGLTARLDNIIKSIPGNLESSKESLQDAERSVATYQEQLQRPFSGTRELQEAQRKLSEVQGQLSGQKLEGDADNAELVEDLLDDDHDDYAYDHDAYEQGSGLEGALTVSASSPVEAEPPPTVVSVTPELASEIPLAAAEETGPPSRGIQESLAALPDKLAADQAFQNAKLNSGEQNARIEFEQAMQRAIIGGVRTDTELYRQYMEDPEFQASLNERLWREQMGQTTEADEEPAEVSPELRMTQDLMAYNQKQLARVRSPQKVAKLKQNIANLEEKERRLLAGVDAEEAIGGITREPPPVGEVLQTTSDGTVVRWAAEDAPTQIPDPPIAPDVVPVDVDALETLHDQNEADLESARDDQAAPEQQVQELQEELAEADTQAKREDVASYLEDVTEDRDDLKEHVSSYEALDDEFEEAIDAAQDSGEVSHVSDEELREVVDHADTDVSDEELREALTDADTDQAGEALETLHDQNEADLESARDDQAAPEQQVQELQEELAEADTQAKREDVASYLEDVTEDRDDLKEHVSSYEALDDEFEEAIDAAQDSGEVSHLSDEELREVVDHADTAVSDKELRETLNESDTALSDEEVREALNESDTALSDEEVGEVVAHADAAVSDEELREALTDADTDQAEEEPTARRRWLVEDPRDELAEVDLDDPEERRDMAFDAVVAMSPEVRETHDALEERLGDLLDEYELAMLAHRLGPNVDPDALDKEEARLRRQHALNIGQVDMFGATADQPEAFTILEPVPKEEAVPDPIAIAERSQVPLTAEPVGTPTAEPIVAVAPDAMPVRAEADCNALMVKRMTRGDGYNILDDDKTIGTIVQQGNTWLIKHKNRKVTEAKTLTAAKAKLDSPEVCEQLLQRQPAMALAASGSVRAPQPKVKPIIEHPVTSPPKKTSEPSGKTNRGKGIARIKRRFR